MTLTTFGDLKVAILGSTAAGFSRTASRSLPWGPMSAGVSESSRENGEWPKSAFDAFDFNLLSHLDPGESAERFANCGYLRLPALITDTGLGHLRLEMARLLERAKRRDFDMESMGGTPRHMTTLGGLEIAKTAPPITAFYHDDKFMRLLGDLVGLDLVVADDPVERYVLNHLHQAGDTHGLHTDDYPIALVIFLESPRCAEGCGHLEFFDACKAGNSSLLTHQAGDGYLLRADRLPHRVRPIHDGCVRTVLNFAYGASSIPVKRSGTASILYSS